MITFLKNRKLFYYLSLTILVFLPWSFSSDSMALIELNQESIGYYQQNPCKVSFFDINSNIGDDLEVEYHVDISKSVECFGKVSWIEVKKNIAKIYIGTNFSLDILYQSVFWLMLIYLIPQNNNRTYKINNKSILLLTLLIYLHLKGEGTFYKIFSREFDIDIISKEFNGDFYYKNYFLYALIFSIILTMLIVKELLKTRYFNVINYFPFIFLITGSFNSFNLNFFILVFALIGINSLFEVKINYKIYYLYLIFVSAWFYNLTPKYTYFDIDKLKGFINSSESNISLLFWSLIFPLTIMGLVNLVKSSRDILNIDLLKLNFLISGSFVCLFGIISASNNIANFFSYYFLGLNKFGIRTLESVEGNSWRGLSPSAEGIGEFFGFVILFTIIISLNKKKLPTKAELFLIVINLFGLYKSNNFAAFAGLTLLLLIFLIENKYSIRKTKNLIYLFIVGGITVFYLSFINLYNYEDLSKAMLSKAIIASDIPIEFEKNEVGDTAVDKSNFAIFLQIPKEDRNFSTSLNFLLEKYNNSGSNNIPNLISLVSVISVVINRSEKWGIFIAKYNPDLGKFLFGYGPQQLSNYHNNHLTNFNEGLIIPHSSLLNYQIFFGFIGVTFLLIYLLKELIKNKNHPFKNYLIAYIVINAFKSDALLYFQNLTLLVIILFLQFNQNNEFFEKNE